MSARAAGLAGEACARHAGSIDSVRQRCRPGMTLVELIVAIALLALLTAVAVQMPLAAPPRDGSVHEALDSVRRRAMREGHTEHVLLRDSSGTNETVETIEATALPTGGIIADTLHDGQRFTGGSSR